MRTPDPAFADPRLAALYDVFDDDRRDLDVYVAIVEELGAGRVVDIGCGTGSLAVLLAEKGLQVTGLDPAAASIDVARAKPHAELVAWLTGDATVLADLRPDADLAVMTGNVAQVFVDDGDWSGTLEAVRGCLHPGGWLVFETRRPEARAWEEWEHWDPTPTSVVTPGGETVVVSRRMTEVALPLVTFESTTTLGGVSIPSASTLRFRDQAEVEADLDRHGFEVIDVRDAPDRPGQEHVFLARRVR